MNTAKKFSIIVACDNQSVIGIKEYGQYSMPWPNIKEDMDYFKELTTKNQSAIIVGYNTWTTLSNSYKNNPNRKNIVISKFGDVTSFDSALDSASSISNVDKIFVIGGAITYHQALANPMLEKIYLTHIDTTYPLENVIEQKIYFPLDMETIDYMIDKSIIAVNFISEKKHDLNKNIGYQFKIYDINNPLFSDVYRNKCKPNIKIDQIIPINNTNNNEEYQYLNLIRNIMEEGISKETRNGKVKSIFGCQLEYDLSKGYPLSTIKKSYPKTIFEELMWMIRGQTDVKILQQKNVHIWDKNSSKEFLNSQGLSYQECDIGPGYGFQMRHYGEEYVNCHTTYQGFDQLQECIDLIKNDSFSRRIIINLWNPKDVKKQALPPCHVIYNFTVEDENSVKRKLNCHLFQRSWDVLLGWNTSTAALLTYILANHCGLEPGKLVHSVTDAHLYQTHIDSGLIDKILKRTPRRMPTLKFLTKRENIEDYTYLDMVLENYYPCPAINAEMVA